MSDLVTMNCLGRGGRWGNQVFEYTFLRTYAKRHGLDYQCNKWVGQILMGHNDPPITEKLPVYREVRDRKNRSRGYGITFAPKDGEMHGHDFQGYAQFHTDYYAPDKGFIQGLFTPTAIVQERMAPVVEKLRSRGKTLIGFHLRRGDTGRYIFYLTPNAWYLKWLEEHWHTFENPVLFVASEVPKDREAFSAYNSVMSSDLMPLSSEPYSIYRYLRYDLDHPTPISMDWYPDWYLLAQCNVLVFGNSTFSFTAGMIGNPSACYRSKLSTQEFSLVDPWSAYPLEREDIRDYPGVVDTWLDRNPQWKGGEVNRG